MHATFRRVRRGLEVVPMAIQDDNEHEDFDAEALAALVRPSAAGQSLADEKKPAEAEAQKRDTPSAERNDAVLDLRALAGGSVAGAPSSRDDEPTVLDPPRRDSGVDLKAADAPASVEVEVDVAPSGEGSVAKPRRTTASASAPAKAAVAPVVASQATAERRSGGGMFAGIAIGVLLAGGAAYAFITLQQADES